LTYKTFQLPEALVLKPGLIKMIEEVRKAFPWCRLAVQTNGWNSPKGDWQGDWLCPAFEIVKMNIEDLLPRGKPYRYEAWFNVLDPGGIVNVHNHHLAQLSAVYHIEGSGDLLLSGVDVIPAREGRIVIFDGMQNHSVPGPITERRLSIAFNFHG